MRSYYERLVEEKGLDAAKEYMRGLRGKVKSPGLANASESTRLRVSKLGLRGRGETKPTDEQETANSKKDAGGQN